MRGVLAAGAASDLSCSPHGAPHPQLSLLVRDTPLGSGCGRTHQHLSCASVCQPLGSSCPPQATHPYILHTDAWWYYYSVLISPHFEWNPKALPCVSPTIIFPILPCLCDTSLLLYPKAQQACHVLPLASPSSWSSHDRLPVGIQDAFCILAVPP